MDICEQDLILDAAIAWCAACWYSLGLEALIGIVTSVREGCRG